MSSRNLQAAFPNHRSVSWNLKPECFLVVLCPKHIGDRCLDTHRAIISYLPLLGLLPLFNGNRKIWVAQKDTYISLRLTFQPRGKRSKKLASISSYWQVLNCILNYLNKTSKNPEYYSFCDEQQPSYHEKVL